MLIVSKDLLRYYGIYGTYASSSTCSPSLALFGNALLCTKHDDTSLGASFPLLVSDLLLKLLLSSDEELN